MESKTLIEAMKQRELIQKLLDAVNSQAEYAYLQGELGQLAVAMESVAAGSLSSLEWRWN